MFQLRIQLELILTILKIAKPKGFGVNSSFHEFLRLRGTEAVVPLVKAQLGGYRPRPSGNTAWRPNAPNTNTLKRCSAQKIWKNLARTSGTSGSKGRCSDIARAGIETATLPPSQRVAAALALAFPPCAACNWRYQLGPRKRCMRPCCRKPRHLNLPGLPSRNIFNSQHHIFFLYIIHPYIRGH